MGGPRPGVNFISGLLVAALGATATFAAPFTPGDIVVTRAVGEGFDSTGNPVTGALLGNGVGATVYLDEYTTTGSFVQSIILPNVRNTSGTGNNALVFSGTQNNEGAITLSGDGKYLVVAGYNQTAYRTDLTGANGTNAAPSTTIQRVAGLIDMDGNVNTTTALTDVSSTISIRSAYSSDGTNIWIGGSNGANVTISGSTVSSSGVRYTTLGGTSSTQLNITGTTNDRILNVFGGQLYLSKNATGATTRGIFAVGTGLPTSGGTLSLTQLAGFNATTAPVSTETADDYWFKDANTLYISDQRTNASGGVQKFVFSDTNADGIADAWVFQYNVTLGNTTDPNNPTNTVGAHGLAGMVNADGNAVLFVTTFDGGGANSNRVDMLTDSGTQAGMAASLTVLATSATNSAFRGVEFIPLAAPVPEPASLAVMGIGGVALLMRRRK